MQDEKVLSFLGGVNLLTDPLRLADEEAVKLKNLYPLINGKLAMRKGAACSWFWQRAVSPQGNAQANDYPVNLWMPKFAPNSVLMLSQINVSGELMAVIGLNGDDVTVNSVSKNIAVEYQSGYRPMMIDYGKRVLIATGKCESDGTCIWEVSFTEGGAFQIIAAPVRFTNSEGANVAPRVIFVYQGRVVYGNFGPGYEDCLVFADPDDQPYKINAGTDTTVDVSDVGGRALRLSQLNGDGIVAACEVSVSSLEAPEEACAFILSSEKAIFMPGTPLLTDDTPGAREKYSGTLAPRQVNYPCGCVSADTLVQTPMGLLWASWNDVWAMDIGGIPKRVGTKIRPVLTDGNPLGRYLWHAAYHHETGSYRLAVVALDQDIGEGGSFEIPCKDQWWLDLRGGLPADASIARWYGPQQYRMQDTADEDPAYPGTFIMRTEVRENAASKLWAAHRVSRAATGSGLLASSLITVLVELDAQTGRDSALPVVPTIAGTIFLEILFSQQKNNEIVWEILTKEYDFENPLVDKVFLNLDVQLWIADVMTLEATGIVDGGRDQKVMNVNIDQMGFVGGVDPAGEARMTHQYQNVRLQCDNGERLTGKVFQFRVKNALTGGVGFENIPGFAIPDNGINSQIIVYPSVAGSPGTQFIISLTPGFYTFTALLAHIKAKLEAANFLPGLTWTVEVDTSAPNTLPIKISNNGSGGGTAWFWQMEMSAPLYTPDESSETDKSRRRSRKVGAMLGFYEATDTNTAAKVAANNVTKTIAAHAELAYAKLNVYHFQRKPSGGKYEPNVP